jgi:hypothetical protein
MNAAAVLQPSAAIATRGIAGKRVLPRKSGLPAVAPLRTRSVVRAVANNEVRTAMYSCVSLPAIAAPDTRSPATDRAVFRSIPFRCFFATCESASLSHCRRLRGSCSITECARLHTATRLPQNQTCDPSASWWLRRQRWSYSAIRAFVHGAPFARQNQSDPFQRLLCTCHVVCWDTLPPQSKKR